MRSHTWKILMVIVALAAVAVVVPNTNSFIIRTENKVIEVTQNGRWLELLSYDKGTSPSDGSQSSIDLWQ